MNVWELITGRLIAMVERSHVGCLVPWSIGVSGKCFLTEKVLNAPT